MIQAVLGGKSKGYEYTEDILTSVVFGTLKYIQPSALLIPFIESAFIYDEGRTTLWEKLKSEGIELRSYHDVDYYFWPFHKTYGEPDLILIFSNHAHGGEDLLLVIEVKFKSKKSGVGEKDQLVRYLKAIKNNSIEDFNEPAVTNFKGSRGYIIYLTESTAYSEICASEQIIFNDSNDEKQIFHLRWNNLYKTMEKKYPYFSTKVEEAMVQDLLEFLENVGLRDFSGISLPNESLILELSQPYPVFFHNDSNTHRSYFEQGIDFSFTFDKNIFFRR